MHALPTPATVLLSWHHSARSPSNHERASILVLGSAILVGSYWRDMVLGAAHSTLSTRLNVISTRQAISTGNTITPVAEATIGFAQGREE